MKPFIGGLVASASLLAITTSAFAQTAAPAPQPAGAQVENTALEEVVVTARRKSESLQDVPQSVSAFGAQSLEKLNIQRFEDVQKVAPGVTLQANGNGISSGASMRGVSYDAISGANPTVAMYLNDAPVPTAILFQTLYDPGQVEVLRGPQGTNRGVAAPSGAITLTTKLPSLFEYGGYASGTLSDEGTRNAQGAVNIPLIQDKLAVRIAGIIDRNNGDGVESISTSAKPRSLTKSGRISFLFEPTDDIRASLVYTHIDRDQRSYLGMFGPGTLEQGAVLTPQDRKSNMESPNLSNQHADVVTAKLDWDLGSHTVSYVGSYTKYKNKAQLPLDYPNLVDNFEWNQGASSNSDLYTQEIRISSDTGERKLFSYTVGAFYSWQENASSTTTTGTFLNGAFGAPGTFDVSKYDPRYALGVRIRTPGTAGETSLFGSLTAHLGADTEVTAGIRKIYSIQRNYAVMTQSAATIAVAVPAPCNFAGLPASPYAGFCDVPLAGSTLQNLSRRTSLDPTVWSVSASHKVTRDLMLYANAGSSWRPGPMQVGIFNAANDPGLNSLIFLKPEKSQSIEAGAKWTFFDGRGRLNFAAYHQKFDDLIFRTKIVPTINTNPDPYINFYNVTTNGDAIVDGFDFDAAFKITPEWNVSLAASYSDGHLDNASVPCNDGNFDGTADTIIPTLADYQAHNTAVAYCVSNGSVTQNAPWNLTVGTEYNRPVLGKLNGFVRALVNYSPKNDRRTDARVIDAFTMVDLFAGVASDDGAWEVSLFAKNLLDTDKVLDQQVTPYTISATQRFYSGLVPSTSDYTAVQMTRPREVGITLRYAFGSR